MQPKPERTRETLITPQKKVLESCRKLAHDLGNKTLYVVVSERVYNHIEAGKAKRVEQPRQQNSSNTSPIVLKAGQGLIKFELEVQSTRAEVIREVGEEIGMNMIYRGMWRQLWREICYHVWRRRAIVLVSAIVTCVLWMEGISGF